MPQSILYKIINTIGDNRSLIPRLVVGCVFLSEGIQKYLFPDSIGAGRFEKIGFTNPEFWAMLVATFEIVGGTFILLGLFTRVAVLPLLIVMATAIVTTKIPILHEKGFWSMAHESRTDYAMTMLLIFLLIYGAGKFSGDQRLLNKVR